MNNRPWVFVLVTNKMSFEKVKLFVIKISNKLLKNLLEEKHKYFPSQKQNVPPEQLQLTHGFLTLLLQGIVVSQRVPPPLCGTTDIVPRQVI